MSVKTSKNSKKMKAQKNTPQNVQQVDFKTSKFTIRFKLTAIIVILVVFSLGSMSILASYYFGKESALRIQEYNLGVAQGIGRQVETELESIKNHGVSIAKLANQKNSVVAEELFNKSKDFIFLGLLKPEDLGQKQAIKFKMSYQRKSFYEKNNLTSTEINKIHVQNRDAIKRASSGELVIFNSSKDKIAMLGLCFREEGGNIIVIYINPEKLIKIFNAESIVVTFMVDGLGNIIAHQNINLLLSRLNVSKIPIVNSMFKSSVRSGQLSYNDTDNKKNLGSFYQLDKGNLGVIAYISEEVVFQPVRKLQIRNFLILVLVLLTALIFTYFFAKTLSVPILSLVRAATEIESGRFEIDIKPVFRDEVGSLTASFERMARGLGEREKIKDAFGRFVNKEIAEQVLKGDVKLGGEKKIAAIFFSDLRGFTAMSEKMKPEQVVKFLNSYFTEMVHCVEKTYGVVDKYIGDAIMAHWGAIGQHGNESENAINAALMMRTALIKFNKSGEGKRPIAMMGCGINTGPVISGQIGSESRLDYTVIGDAVNLASRVEALNKPFGTDILITSDTYQKVNGIFKVEKMPSIRVKGKEDAQIIYAVLGRTDDPECPKNIDEVRKKVGIILDKELLSKASKDNPEEEKKYKIEE